MRKNEGKEGKVKAGRRIIGAEGKGATEEELQEWKGTVCGGRRWSAVVRCKSPSTAFNYDVIANTDDGYFLRYTLYITRGPTASTPEPKAVGGLRPCVRPYVLYQRPNRVIVSGCFRTRRRLKLDFRRRRLSDSLTSCLDPPSNVHLG